MTKIQLTIYGHSDFCKQNQVLTRVVLQPSIRILYKALLAFIPDAIPTNKKTLAWF